MRATGWLSYPRLPRDGAYDFRVYASGPCHPAHPARFVPQYPMGADGYGSAGLPEISEDRECSDHLCRTGADSSIGPFTPHNQRQF